MRAANRWYTMPSLLIVLIAAGCKGVLDVHPVNDVDEDQAITSPGGARAAVAGLYDALQDFSYYGGELFFFGDLSGDDVEHMGTFTTYRQIDRNDITSDNGSVEGYWDALYRAVARANTVIEKVPGVAGLDPVERDDLVGQAHFIRALSLHNLVKFFGDTAASGLGVPLVLTPPQSIGEAGLAVRATTGEAYAQILSDLNSAETLMAGASFDPLRASVMAVRAVRSRVYLYQKNYAGAETEAEAVAAIGGFTLDSEYGHLFTAEGADSPEDIFRLHFDAVDFCWEGFYYRHSEEQGRREISPSVSLITAYEPNFNGSPGTYNPTDLRGQHNITFYDPTDGTSVYGSKWPSGIGAEDMHVIRFAEVLLIQAEAEARQNKLVEAEATLTPVRTRAGLAAAGLDTMTQANAILAILNERRLELAMEGDRWPDLVRTGRVQAVMPTVPPFQTLYPIPLNELDVAPGLVQNPGY
ncbi:MAG TPA: RagB/SusD family nutrient uptake outer membrane protein [Gemmatimonadales bacterium]|nr:RagB/SusD family nutrient uptake outer membrane protein [Gemmatimonadales bacterium]